MFWSVEELETLPAGTKPRASKNRSSGGERRRKTRSTIFIERTRERYCQSDQHWNCLKGNAEVTSEKRGGAQMVIPECVDIILSWAELLHKYPPFWHGAVTRLATRHISKDSISFLPSVCFKLLVYTILPLCSRVPWFSSRVSCFSEIHPEHVERNVSPGRLNYTDLCWM